MNENEGYVVADLESAEQRIKELEQQVARLTEQLSTNQHLER